MTSTHLDSHWSQKSGSHRHLRQKVKYVLTLTRICQETNEWLVSFMISMSQKSFIPFIQTYKSKFNCISELAKIINMWVSNAFKCALLLQMFTLTHLFLCKQKDKLSCWGSLQVPTVWSLSFSCCWTLAHSWHGTAETHQEEESKINLH